MQRKWEGGVCAPPLNKVLRHVQSGCQCLYTPQDGDERNKQES